MIDRDRAVLHLLDLLAVEGSTGREGLVAQAITDKLLAAGCERSWITSDDAHMRLGEGYETGNLIVQMPGSVKGPRIMFSAHMDTVPLCKGAKPVRRGDRIESEGATGLGADDRTGCAAMVTLAETLLKNSVPHPPITLLFPIAEENGLNGSRLVRFEDLGHPVMGFNLDGQEPNELIIGAMSAARWSADIFGRSAHAGLDPHKGISAGLIAAKAMARIGEKGYFGRIVKGEQRGTSNLGTIHGGEANNQVMDRVRLTGECRSHCPVFLERIIEVYRSCFEEAAASIMNEAGQCGRVEFWTNSEYRAFRLNRSEPCVQVAERAIRAVGLEPNPLVMDAGLDANNFNEKGFPVVTLGAGAHHFHTVDEYVDLAEYQTACCVLLHIVRLCAE